MGSSGGSKPETLAFEPDSARISTYVLFRAKFLTIGGEIEMLHSDFLLGPSGDDDTYLDDNYDFVVEPWPDEMLDDFYYVDESNIPPVRRSRFQLDGISLVAVALVLLVAFWLVTANAGLLEAAAGVELPPANVDPAERPAPPQTEAPDMSKVAIDGGGYQSVATSPTDDMVVAPYDSYILTQGPHGYSYGHTAIDISAGKGAEIRSPIQGTVTAFYYDEVGNTSLLIENSRYQVLLLHGLYTVEVGQAIALGQVIGTESNQGNTLDMAGNSCRNRDCGYHTHLNIYDKTYGVNVNPLELLP
jgi:murein DD-endopeptidase MepM/ murein hydrolase activator NlpD